MTKIPKITMIFSLLCSLVFQTIYFLQMFKINLMPNLPYPYVFLFPVWLFYFVAGMYFVNNHLKYDNLIEKHGLIIFIAWILNLIFVISENAFTSIEGSTIKPSVMLYCITSFFFFYWLGKKLKSLSELFVKLSSWISEQSFLIYFCHPLILGLISTGLYILNLEFLSQRFFGKVIIFITVITLSSIFSYFLSLSKFTPFIGGVQKRK